MEILVTYITVNQRGQTQRDQRRISDAVLTLGRGSQCQIHLPDPRVALSHARLTVTEATAAIEAEPGRIVVNGRDADGAELSVGDRVEIGPYLIEVESPSAGVRLALAVRLVSSFGKAAGQIRRRVRPRAPQLSMRRLSYLAFFGILLIFLLLPAVPDALRGAELRRPDSRMQMEAGVLDALGAAFSQSWNPGPVSQSHQVFGKECRACHAIPFIQARDRECIACHKMIGEHAPRTELTGPRGVILRETRCAECHRDHKDAPMARRTQKECADCHKDIRSAAPGAHSRNVTDFRSDHPQFRLSMLDANRPGVIRRVRQGNPASPDMVERSNLKFNHKLHLDPGGVRDPEGKRDVAGTRDAKGRRTVLQCGDCHVPIEGGRLMAPVSMERHCQRCHSLAFEPKVTKRQVVHGDDAEIETTLREFYARLVLGDVPPDVNPPPDLPRMRPGAVLTYQDRQRVLQIADRKASLVLRELFETRKVCSTCHEVARNANGVGWKVAPVRITQIWMPKALFSHAKHGTEKCTKCHDVSQSKDAKHIAMPDIATCRECHVGARPVVGKVTSDCATCHKFHYGRNNWFDAMQAQMLSGERK